MNVTSHLQSKAIIVGINYYGGRSGVCSLEAPSKDAQEIASLLDKYGADQKMFISRIPREQIQNQQGKSEERVKDNEFVKKDYLEKEIGKLFNPPNDNPPNTVFFFFSGHGVLGEKDINGNVEVYLATSDRHKKKGKHGIKISDLGKQIQESKAKEVIVWLDCCYSGELLKYCPDNKRYCFVTATTSYQEGYTSCEKGELTKVLIEGLKPKEGLKERVNSHDLCEFLKNHQPRYGQRFQYKNSDAPISLTALKPVDYQNKCPYVALSAFQKDDADFFFGRSKLINDLLDKLRNRKQERLVAILGASGSGKSSVMRAGLLHEIEEGQKIPGSNHWEIIEPFSPTDKPSEELDKRLEVSHFHDIDEDRQIIIMVDQFEECFTMCDQKTRTEFVDRLMELMDNHANLQIIIAMRDGFRGRLREFPYFSQQMSPVNVGPLNLKEIEEAIEKPAKEVGLTIEDSLKQQLRNDVYGYRGSLPLLQYTLTELWNKAHQNKERVLRLSVYEALGGIEGTLEKRAEEIYYNLGPIPLIGLLLRSGLLNSSDSFGVSFLTFLLLLDYQKVAQRIFLELTQIGGTSDTRRRVKLGELENSHHSLDILDEVTKILASEENRLLTRSDGNVETSEKTSSLHQKNIENQGDVVIDVVHEALIRHWPRLGNWKQEYREGMIIEREIEDRAQQWYNGRGDLLRATGLEVANKYLEKYGELGMLDHIAEKFIEKSERKDNARREIEDRRKADLEHKKEQLEKRNQELQDKQAELEASKKSLEQMNEKLKINEQGLEKNKVWLENSNKELEASKLKLENRNQELQNKQKELKKQRRFLWVSLIVAVLLLLTTGFYAASTRKAKNQASLNDQVATVEDQLTEPEDVQPLRDIKPLIGALAAVKANLTLNETPLYKLEECQWNLLMFKCNIQLQPKVSALLIKAVQTIPKRHTFKGHRDDVISVAFSPDGRYLVSGSNDNTIKLWDAENRGEEALLTFTGHRDDVISVAFSPDGRYLVSGSDDKNINLWDTKNPGKDPKTFTGHQGSVRSVAISSDGKTIVSGSDDGTINLWDTKNPGKDPKTFTGHQGSVRSVAISSDGKTIVSGSNDGTIKLWDAENLEQEAVHNFTGHVKGDQKYPVTSVAISSDGKTIASGGADGMIKLWDAENRGEEALHTFTGHRDYATESVAFSPDGKTIVSGNFDGTIKLWDAENRGEKALYTIKGHEGHVRSVAFAPNGKYIVSGGNDRMIKLWDAENRGEKALDTIKGHPDSVVSSVTFSPDGKTMVSGSNDGTIKLWDTKNSKLLHTFTGHEDYVRSVAFSPDGKTMVSGSNDGTIKLWDTKNSKLLHTFTGHKDYVRSVAFSPDGKYKYIVSGSDDNTIKLWDAENRGEEALLTFTGHRDDVISVAFSPDGRYIVSGSDDGTIKLWDAENRGEEALLTFTGHRDDVISVAFSPDGRYLVSGSNDNTIKLWDTKNPGKEAQALHTFTGHQGPVRSVAISSDGRYLVSGSNDGTIKLWDTKNREKEAQALHTFTGHQGHVRSVAISSDGRYLVSGSNDGTIKLWDAKNWQQLVVDQACGWLRLHPDFALPTSEKESNPEQQALANAVEVCMENDFWERKEQADFLLIQGLAIARTKEDIKDIKEEAMNKFEDAKKLHKNIEIEKSEYEKQVNTYIEEKSPQKLIIASRKEAKLGKSDTVKMNLQKLDKLNTDNNNSHIKLEELRKELMTMVAQAWIEEVSDLVDSRADEDAKKKLAEIIKFIKEEELDIEPRKEQVSLDADSWNKLCWFGSIYGYSQDISQDILFACDKAVSNANFAEDKANFQDSRGLAKALREDRQGAIKDFQAFIDNDTFDEKYRNKRQKWVEALKRGDKIDDIFTEKVLEELKNE